MTTPPPFALRGDRPIETAEQDRLGRAIFARAITAQILEAPALDSYVVAIMGPWGSGKTSMMNMIAEEARLRSDAVVLNFNPWIFSGAEQLVGHFFRELGAQMTELRSDRLAAVGSSLKKYAGLFGSVAEFIPTVGNVAKKVAEIAGDVGQAIAEGPSILSQRDTIRDQLTKSEQRIVVLIDDIDRLRREEIRELVKLVRLTGDFPNIVYVLAFDRRRVEAALGDDDETGRAYLEKIVQVAYDVPIVHDSDLTKLLLDELGAATDGIEHGPLDKMEWTNVFHKVIRPLFGSPRDVRRYVNALPPTLRVIGPEVALTDVLALEAVRVFLPELFGRLPSLIGALTASPQRDREKGEHENAVQRFVEDAGKHREAVQELVLGLFPNAAHLVGGTYYDRGFVRQWRRDRRVAVVEVLRFYLERRLPEGMVAAAEVQSAFQLLSDRNALTALLETFGPERFENLVSRLEVYEDDFPPEHVESAVGALLDQAGRLREGKRHFFDMGSDMALNRVILRLLRRQERTEEREAIVGRVLPTLHALSARQSLIHVAEGHKLAEAAAIASWKADLVAAVAMAPPEHLAAERQLVRLLAEAIEAGEPNANRARRAIEDDRVLLRVLSSAITERSTLALGDVASVQENRLRWEGLTKLFGAEALETRVRELRSRVANDELDGRQLEALELALRYASGWRPKDDFWPEEEESTDDVSDTEPEEEPTDDISDAESEGMTMDTDSPESI